MCGCVQAGLGASPAFRVPEYELQSMFELPLVLVLGALCGLASSAFKASSQVTHLKPIIVLQCFSSRFCKSAYVNDADSGFKCAWGTHVI